MNMSSTASGPWLFFLFNLPGTRASERVKVWRRLKKFGALQLKRSPQCANQGSESSQGESAVKTSKCFSRKQQLLRRPQKNPWPRNGSGSLTIKESFG